MIESSLLDERETEKKKGRGKQISEIVNGDKWDLEVIWRQRINIIDPNEKQSTLTT